MPPTAPVTSAVQDARPLTDDERDTLGKLLARDSALHAPADRRGDPYLALANLNVPRRGTHPDRLSDIVMAGEVVNLTPEEAAGYLRCDPMKDGRQVPVIRKLTGPDGSREPFSKLPPRAVSGRIFMPPPPPPGSDAPRPDPQGSSVIEYLDNPAIPEANQPQPDPSEFADHLRAQPGPDAADLPPSRHRERTRQGRPV